MSGETMANADSRVTIHMAASLDGFIARKDGSVDWLETSDRFEGGEVMAPESVAEFLRTIDCYVMGSRTYEKGRGNSERLDYLRGFGLIAVRDLPLDNGAHRMGPKPRKPYPSDLTDEQWAVLEPLLPPPVPAGAPRRTDLREVLNAIFYVLSTGCAWSALPHDFPPEGTVRDYFHQWRRGGLWQAIHEALRRRVREAAGKEPEPSAGSIDSQTVKATRTAGTRGYDAGKKNQRHQEAYPR
jgi:transposase